MLCVIGCHSLFLLWSNSWWVFRHIGRPYCCMPEFCCHSCLRHWEVHTEYRPGLVLFNQTVDFTVYLVWRLPAAFWGFGADISGMCRSSAAQWWISGVYSYKNIIGCLKGVNGEILICPMRSILFVITVPKGGTRKFVHHKGLGPFSLPVQQGEC